MKLTRSAAAAVSFALAALVVFGVSSTAANAATPGVVYVTAADIPASIVPFQNAGGWFTSTGGSSSSGLSGLTIANRALVFGFATPPPANTGTALTAIASTMSIQSDQPASLQPSIYIYPADPIANPNSWTLTLALPGDDIANPATTWISPTPVGSIPGGTPATLAQFDAQLAVDPVFATAVITCAGWTISAADVYSAHVLGTTYVFTPTPVVTSAPTTIAFADYIAAPGVTVSTTGFLPNEVVDVYYSTPDGGGQIGTVTADAGGALTYTHFDAAATKGGAYSITLVGETATDNPQRFDFTVAKAELAETGVDATPYLAVSSALLLSGVALVQVVAARRRRHG